MVLLIDNYDSFVYNLARYVAELGCRTRVVRNDAISVDEIQAEPPAAIILSPGPCTPNEAGVSVDIVRHLGGHIPILGVCLGHQAIGVACGADVVRAREPVHGRTSLVHHTGLGVLEGLPNPLEASRYHSLVVAEDSLPDDLIATAHTEDGVVMAIQHRTWPVYGVQFHPESILTVAGHRLLRNFLLRANLAVSDLPPGDREPDAAPLRPSSRAAWTEWNVAAGPPLHW